MGNKKSLKWAILIILTFGAFIVSLDMSIVNLAISKMQLTFNASLDQIQWVLSAYTLALGVMMPASAYFCDRYGAKKIFVFAMSLFTIGSLLCGISWSTSSIIIFRVIQGLAGGVLIPLVMTMVVNTYSEADRGIAMAVIGISGLLAPAVGPTLGGYIIENLDWRLVFFINIPIGVIAVILAIILVQESERKSSLNFDVIGFISSSIGLGCILYVLGKTDLNWGELENILFIIIGGFCLAIFVVNELMIPEPMLNLRLLKNYTFCMSNIIINITLLSLYGGVFLVPVFLQQLKGLSPMQTGMILFPEALATVFSMLVASKLLPKLGARSLAIFALVLLAINGFSMSKITFDTSSSAITMILMVRGLGVGLLMMPVQLAGFNALPKETASNASALLNTIKQIGTAIGITIITTIMQHRNAIDFADLSSQVNTFNPNSLSLFSMLKGLLIQGGVAQTDAPGGALYVIYGTVAKQSMLQGLDETMLIIAVLTLIIILPTFLLKETKYSENEVRPTIVE